MTKWDTGAYWDGVFDYVSGLTIDENPYDIETDDFKHDSWEEGWIKASLLIRCKQIRGGSIQ